MKCYYKKLYKTITSYFKYKIFSKLDLLSILNNKRQSLKDLIIYFTELGSPCELNEHCTVSLSTEPANQRACLNNSCTCATGFRVMKGEDHCEKSKST